MTVYGDTSAFFAIVDRGDENHLQAGAFWTNAVDEYLPVVTTNYVLLETLALLQRRLGLQSARRFATDVVPLLLVHWVDEVVHEAALLAVFTAGRRDLSLVDCVSFEVMRRLGLSQAFAFDTDFSDQGFQCVP